MRYSVEFLVKMAGQIRDLGAGPPFQHSLEHQAVCIPFLKNGMECFSLISRLKKDLPPL